jgi:transcriptional regulator with XRE-family HTH domain
MTGDQIKRIRGALGFTQSSFGKLLHSHAGTVSRWENESRKPDAWQLTMLESLSKVAFESEAPATALQHLKDGDVSKALGVLLRETLDG